MADLTGGWTTAVISAVVGAVSVGIGALTGRKTREAEATEKIVAAAGTAAEQLARENARLSRRVDALEEELQQVEQQYARLERYLRSLGLAVPTDFQ